MASKNKYVWLGAALVLSVVSGLALILTKDREQPRILAALNSLPSKREALTIQARLLANKEFVQPDTQFVDFSEFAHITVALLTPAVPSRLNCHNIPAVCEIRFTAWNEAPLTVTPLWLGGGGAFPFTCESRCFGRTGPLYPLAGEKYADEVGSLCGLIKAVIDGDLQKRAHCESHLRISLGLKKAPERPRQRNP